MDNNVQIQRTVFKKDEFTKVVDKSFKTYIQPSEEQDLDTPEELFRLYEKLYYVIDIQGETDSHEYLARRSSEIASFEKNTEDIQPLLDEISQLRAELLLANQQILTAETQIP